MSVWAILLVYVTLAKPTRIVLPPATVAVESNADCVNTVQALVAQHAFDKPGLALVFAGCEKVTTLYRKDGTKL